MFLKKSRWSIICCFLISIACSSDNKTTQADIIFPTTPVVDSMSAPSQINAGDFHKLDVRNDWEFYGNYNNLITSDSEAIYIGRMGSIDMMGISSYLWSGSNNWTVEDNAILSEYTRLNGPVVSVNISSDYVIASYEPAVVFLSKETGLLLDIKMPQSDCCINTEYFSPTEVHSLSGHFILVWPAFFLKSSRNVLSVTDDSLNCVWELTITGEESPFILEKTLPHGTSVPLITLDSLPSNGGFNIACTDSSIFVNPAWLDLFLELDIDGNLLAAHQGTHTFNSSRNISYVSTSGSRSSRDIVIRELVSQIQYLDNGLLAIMYGPGAFASDSSELWCVDLNTGKYGILPFSKSVTSFSATNNNVVISSCIFSQDSTTDRWRAIDGEITAAAWSPAPISSQLEQQ